MLIDLETSSGPKEGDQGPGALLENTAQLTQIEI